MLAKMAEEDGLDILVATDYARLSWAWGFRPLQNVLRVQFERRSVFQSGVGRYLAAVADVDRRHPNLLVIPGIEVAAHYHFSGDPLQGNLVAHNWHRRMHVLGLKKPEDYLALPMAGGPSVDLLLARGASGIPVTVWPYLLPGIYLLCSLIGVILMLWMGFRRVLGSLVYLVFIPLAVNELPFLKSPSDPYGGDPGIQPYQALIDGAVRAGGIVLWARPDSPLQKDSISPLMLETPPHPEVLFQSYGYTAFDTVYDESLGASAPGKQWDRVLGEYVRGRRQSPVWVYGGIGLPGRAGNGGRGRLSDVQTVLFLKERTELEVLSALQKGRMYAVKGRGPSRLRLDQFIVIARDQGVMALIGETVTAVEPPEIRFRISTGDDSPKDLTVQLIRNGEVIQTYRGKTPFQVNYIDPDPPTRGKVYYRLDAMASPSERLLTNPIFVLRP
ncbi:MAG: hypothetical protein ACE5JS_18515 [Nitrospinota bacterium]